MSKTVAYVGYYRHTYLGKINRKKILEGSIEEELQRVGSRQEEEE